MTERETSGLRVIRREEMNMTHILCGKIKFFLMKIIKNIIKLLPLRCFLMCLSASR